MQHLRTIPILLAGIFSLTAACADDTTSGPPTVADMGCTNCGDMPEDLTEDAPVVIPEVCGDGNLADDEECDDGNAESDDGCSSTCAIEAGWICDNPGEECTASLCGDGVVAGDEACDDLNAVDGDGCSTACEIEPGWVCLQNGDCIAQQCGDGIVAGQERCDDGNTEDGDGCSSNCETIEPNFICPTPGDTCQSTVVCGDRRVGPGETCDDGNLADGDGCSADCELEAGWACSIPGAACRAAQCGDGILAGLEQCDDGDLDDADGCSSTCTVEDGWACPANMSCFQTVCGDGNKEGSEQCDDGNNRPFDGCSADCKNEPSCSGGACVSICGDGVILPGPNQEPCDDGNTRDGDGCSANCTVEPGWTCTIEPQPLPTEFTLPLVIRDFKGIQWYADNTTEYGHIDFNDPNDGNSSISFGIVNPQLGADGRPDLAYAAANPADGTGLPKFSARFDEWYDSSSPWNIEVLRFLTLSRAANQDTFAYDSTAQGFPPYSTSGFFPIDDDGWVGQGSEALRASDANVNDGANHNFNFTTETRFFFEYEGDEVLSFSGDDDLWVFIDGRLCLDVGGIHPEIGAVMNLADPSQESNATQRAIVEACRAHLDSLITQDNPTPLVEMVIFHAERHTTASNFEIELTGFVRKSSSCVETCGDGVVTISEVCDDGVNDGSYNGCSEDCLNFGDYCGDGTVNGPEACDNGGTNDGTYGGCNPDCSLAGFCGDGVVQPLDEACDDGVNDGSYGGCSEDCQTRSDFCGDGIVNGPEACDDGVAANLGEYDGCNPDCTRAPYCGDGIKQGDEECDDGNNSDVDGCTRTCIAPLL